MSDEAEYVYGVDDHYGSKSPELVKATVLKETPKRVEIRGGGRAFGCRTYLDPITVCRTPRDAWERFAEVQRARIGIARQELEDAQELERSARQELDRLDGAHVEAVTA